MKKYTDWSLPDELKLLAKSLGLSSYCAKSSSGSDEESWDLTHHLTDLDKSFRRFSEDLLPKLLQDDVTPSIVDDTLQDIGDELRHILYHVRGCGYYAYLSDDASDST